MAGNSKSVRPPYRQTDAFRASFVQCGSLSGGLTECSGLNYKSDPKYYPTHTYLINLKLIRENERNIVLRLFIQMKSEE